MGASVEPTLVMAGPVCCFVGKVGADEYVLPAVAREIGGMDYTQLRPAADVVQYLQCVQQNAVPGQCGGAVPALRATIATSPSSPAPTLTLGLSLAGIAGAVAVWHRRRLPR